MNKIIEVEGLSKGYKNFKLEDVSFSLERGFIMGLIGPNGAGKSTTIKLIMNLIKRDNGKIRIFGSDIIDKNIKQKIGFVYDDLYVYEDITVKSFGKIFEMFYYKWDENLFNKNLKKFDIDPNKKIRQLSRGMKVKLSIASALCHDAELLIMDEPTSGLDPLVRREILNMLQDFISDGRRSVLFSTHITSDLDRVADYITLLNNGRVLFSSTKDEIVENFVMIKGSKQDVKEVEENLLGKRITSFSVEGLLKKEYLKKLSARCVVEKPNIEDIMFYMIGGNRI